MALLVPIGAAQAVVTQGIAGTLSAQGAGPIAGALNITPVDPGVKLTGADHTISPCDYGQCQFWDTDPQGHFTIALPDGDYWVRFAVAGSSAYADMWLGDSVNRQGSTKVTVTAGQLTDDVDQTLPLAGSITGTIAQAGPGQGQSADGVIEAWVPDSTFPDGRYLVGLGGTSDDGTYTVHGLPSGSYRLRFVTRFTKLEGWWDDKDTFAAATPVGVTAPSTVSGIDPTLKPWGSVTGKVTRADDGTPVSGAVVQPAEDHYPWNQMNWSTDTGADGTFTLKAPADSYKLLFYTPGSNELVPEYWNNANTRADAEPVTITTSQTTSGIDVALEPRATMNKIRPTITGTKRVGSTLTASDGTWYPSGASYSYQWFRNGSTIPGAVNGSYTLVAADLGKHLAVRVTAAKTAFVSAGSNSDATVAIARGILNPTGTPAITGAARVGKILHGIRPTTTPASIATYQWLRNGKPISRSSEKARYKLRAQDKGKRISVRITLRRPGYKTVVSTVVRSTNVR